jgi:hypothetical protein
MLVRFGNNTEWMFGKTPPESIEKNKDFVREQNLIITLGDGDVFQQRAKLIIISNSQSNVARDDALFLVVASSKSSKL